MDLPARDARVHIQQVMGFPAHDGKQYSQLSGNIGCSSLFPCPGCGRERKDFDLYNVILWKRYRDREVQAGRNDPGECKWKPPIKRVGEKCSLRCAEVYSERTNKGSRKLSKPVERKLNCDVLSVYNKPHLVEPWWKFCADPLHDSQGTIYHIFKHIRRYCREIDLNQPFYLRVKQAHDEVVDELKTLALTNRNGSSVVAGLHRESTAIENRINKKLESAMACVAERDEKLTELESIQNKSDEDSDDESVEVVEDADDSDDDDSVFEDVRLSDTVRTEALQEEVQTLNLKINQLHLEADELLEEARKHSDETKYGHYILLHKGLVEFESALKKFLATKCKRPRGLLEFVFNKAIELFGGEFMQEHSGFEQTNKNAMVSLVDVYSFFVLAQSNPTQRNL